MERLILERMRSAGISEADLRSSGMIPMPDGEDLSWQYLQFVRDHPVSWCVPTEILYGSADCLTGPETVRTFAETHHAGLTVMDGGEHWFHTPEQMRFLDAWILEHKNDGL